MKTGVVLNYDEILSINFQWCIKNNIPTCQLSIPPDLITIETEKAIQEACCGTGMEITSLIGVWSGPSNEWNFMYGPLTLGIVPPAFRAVRVKELEKCAQFAKRLGVPAVCTHIGFIPENPMDTLYGEVVAAIRHLTVFYKELGLKLNLETGQETPVTLLRTIQDVGEDNLGVNFDPANLLRYGKANPLDALDIIGTYVNSVHVKDGEYPTDGMYLGKERPLGLGRVNVRSFVEKLYNIGYNGALTIEREISGPEQKQDILVANRMLMAILESLDG